MSVAIKVRNTEIWILAILCIIGWITLAYVIYNIHWIGLSLLTLCLGISIWLYKFYQYQFTKDKIMNILSMAILIISASFIALAFQRDNVESRMKRYFLDGKESIVKGISVSDDGEEYEDYKKVFNLNSQKDSWKSKVIVCIIWIVLIVFPALSVYLIVKLHPIDET